MIKYVVSLTREARAKNLQADVERVLLETRSVKILDGHGRKVFTVLMPEDTRAHLQHSLKYAVIISPYQELELLLGR